MNTELPSGKLGDVTNEQVVRQRRASIARRAQEKCPVLPWADMDIMTDIDIRHDHNIVIITCRISATRTAMYRVAHGIGQYRGHPDAIAAIRRWQSSTR